VAVDAVDADTQDLGVAGAETGQQGLRLRNLLASGGRPIEGVEEQQHVPLAPEVAQLDRSPEVILKLEIGRSFSD